MSNSVAEYFEENRYVYLQNVLTKEHCEALTKHIFDLHQQGKMTQDAQCPLSWSIYGDREFDNILGNLTPHLSAQLGVQLLPTYTYARLYQPGEVLERHSDRESCEISGTLTLGFDPDSEIWPIFFARTPNDVAGRCLTIDVGDLVMYRGNELPHWRPEYKGKWQCQVFFHYVDANGPHKDFKFDKRPALGLEPGQTTNNCLVTNEVKQTKKTETKVNHIFNGVMIPSWDQNMPGAACFSSNFKPEFTFTPEECNHVISFASKMYATKASVGAGKEGSYKPEIRRVDSYEIPLNNDTKWIFDRIAAAVSSANHEYYNYEIMGITHNLQLLHYKEDEKAFYDWHTDIGQGNAATRKISISVHLSDPNEYEGGDLIVNDHGVILNTTKEQGCINMFPSYALHKVTPVVKGERWVIVIWVHGSQRFK